MKKKSHPAFIHQMGGKKDNVAKPAVCPSENPPSMKAKFTLETIIKNNNDVLND